MSLKAQQTQYVQQQGTYPGEDWQVDFTQMQASQGYNYLLVIAYAFTGWTEDFPSWAEEVVKKKKKKNCFMKLFQGLICPGGSYGKVCLQCRRCGLDPWVGKIPLRRKWQPIPVFFSRKSHGQRRLMSDSPWDWVTEGLTLSLSLGRSRSLQSDNRTSFTSKVAQRFQKHWALSITSTAHGGLSLQEK